MVFLQVMEVGLKLPEIRKMDTKTRSSKTPVIARKTSVQKDSSSSDEGKMSKLVCISDTANVDTTPLAVVGSGDEDFQFMTKKVQEAEEKIEKEWNQAPEYEHKELIPVVHATESTDDFIRNYMYQKGMIKTLDTFETEWYELHRLGVLEDEKVGLVPDVFTRCQMLEEQVVELEQDIAKYRSAADKIKEKFTKVCKERDYHRMHHRRVVQEKNKILEKINQLERHYAEYEPTMKNLQKQYEKSIKERVLLMLAKDQMSAKVQSLENIMRTRMKAEETSIRKSLSSGTVSPLDKDGLMDGKITPIKGLVARFPVDRGFSPALLNLGNTIYRAEEFSFSHTFRAHNFPIGGLSFHKDENIFVTASDDRTWKLWNFPPNESIVTGHGHNEWLSDCKIHPNGNKLATTSGDRTAKIWDLYEGHCLTTFTEHLQAVWSCDWHTDGDFLVTASMDFSIKLWDVLSNRCRHTLRGHKDSVNSVQFLPYSNILLSASSDKTVSLWDARTGFCGHKFTGHTHSVLSAAFNIQGNKVASVDCRGYLKVWDVRENTCIYTTDLGPSPANCVIFGPTGNVIFVGGSNNMIHMYDCFGKQLTVLGEQEAAVHCMVFQPMASLLLSGASNGSIRFWIRKNVMR